ncbi:MAG: trypsin-like peptidase domain-containing protein [Tetrasphaera sp.]
MPAAVPDSQPYGQAQAWTSGSWTPDGGVPLPAGPPGRARGPGWPAVISVAVVTGLIAALLGGLVGAGLRDGLPGVLPSAQSGSTVRPEGSIARIAADALPSIVTIRAAGNGESATGSGFVYDNAGHVVTNNHVVEGVGEDIQVVLSSGERIEASVVGTDDAYDIAVLATGRTNLRALPIGDSETVVVGDPVLAVGAPLGLSSTVTSGIVSAVDRPVVAGDASTRSYINAIQTDAAINPGNSGGPLLDAAGRVIGMNSAIAAPPGSSPGSSGNIGLGFAIPSAQIVKTAGQLISKGSAEHPVIGVLLDENYVGQGAKVRESEANGDPVVDNGPADQAGMQPGDVILSFDGRQITDADDLIVAIRAKSVGDSVRMTVRRDGRTVDVTMTLQAAPKKN